MRKAVILYLVLFLSASGLSAQETWSLEKCIDYAIQNNLQIRLQELNESLAQYQLTQTKAGMYPDLNGSASYAINFGRSNNPTTFEFVNTQIQTSSFSLTSNLLLFSGLRQLNTVKKNQLDITAAKFQTDATKNSVMLSITQAYLTILQSGENVKAMQQQLEVSLSQFDQTKKLVDAGVVPEGDLLTIEAQVANDSLNLVIAENGLSLSMLSLKILLQLDPETEIQIEVPEIDVAALGTPDPAGAKGIYDYAVTTQPQVLAADVAVQSSEKSLSIAKGFHSPVLSLFGNVRTNYSSYEAPPFVTREPFFTQLDNNFNQSVGVTLTIPIFNGLSTQMGVKTAKVQLMRSTYQNEQIKNQLKQDVYQAYTDAKAALQKYQASRKNVQALETAFQYTEDRFNLGASNALDYSTARSNLAVSRINLIAAKYDYIFKLKVLDFYQGKPLKLE